MEHLLAVWNYVATHPLGVLGAIVASFLVGFLIHGPLLGNTWVKLNGITPPKPGEMKFSMMLPGIAASIVMPFFQVAVLGRTFEIVAITGVARALGGRTSPSTAATTCSPRGPSRRWRSTRSDVHP